MAKYTIEDTTLTNIAEAIREKGGTTESLTPVQMPEAISAIEAGSGESEPSRITGYFGSTSSSAPQLKSTYSDTTAASAYITYPNLSTSTSSVARYVWYKKTSNDVWPMCYCAASNLVEGATYRVMFYIWCTEGKTVEWSNSNVYFNGNCRTTHDLKPVTSTPQLFDWTFTYTSTSSTYEPTLHIYPKFSAVSGTTLYATPVILYRTDGSGISAHFGAF